MSDRWLLHKQHEWDYISITFAASLNLEIIPGTSSFIYFKVDYQDKPPSSFGK